MNKKIFIAIVLLIATLFCLTACNHTTQYKRLNKMTDSYSQLKMDISVVKAGEGSGLNGQITLYYNADGSITVGYTLEQYQAFGMDGDILTAPDSQKITKIGTVKVKDNQVVEQIGDQVAVDFSQIGQLKITFDQDNFEKATFKDDIFTAKVKDISKLLGLKGVGASNVVVTANYKTLNGLTLCYDANGSVVTIVYTITK